MNIRVCNEDIQLEPISQFCGINILQKNEILYRISKYFSSQKYGEWEEERENDRITVDGQVVGRKYFTVFNIESREDILKELTISKNSIMKKYLDILITDLDNQLKYSELVSKYEEIFTQLNNKISEDNIELILNLIESKILDLCAISDVTPLNSEYLEKLSTFQLIEEFLKIIEKISDVCPEKILIIIKDIDHFIIYEDFVNLIPRLKNMTMDYDVTFLISESIQGYVYIDEEIIPGITVCNDIIYSMPSMLEIKDFITDYYPCVCNMEDDMIINIIKRIINQIGKDDYVMIDKENVMLKLFNDSMAIKPTEIYEKNAIETSFLKHKYMV